MAANNALERDVVVSSRVRLARNYKDIPFAPSMNREWAQETIRRAADALGWAATFLLVQLAWVFFRAQSVSDALYLLAAQFQNASLAGLFDAVFAAYNESFQTALLVYAALAFTLAACAACILCDFWRRFKAPGGDLAGAAMALPRARRWILYYLLAGMVFAGYLLNNGYFATAANTLYQNF